MTASIIENYFNSRSGLTNQTGRIPYVIVDNFQELGLLTSLRFLEWIIGNPEGVISLPTGKTPEYFITWTQKLLAGWGQWDNVLPGNLLSTAKEIPAFSGAFVNHTNPPKTVASGSVSFRKPDLRGLRSDR